MDLRQDIDYLDKAGDELSLWNGLGRRKGNPRHMRFPQSPFQAGGIERGTPTSRRLCRSGTPRPASLGLTWPAACPLLLLYPIEAESKPSDKASTMSPRMALNAAGDLMGFGIIVTDRLRQVGRLLLG